jgi:1-deoxy-D-xylulose-5-phosphate reductoisomerase
VSSQRAITILGATGSIGCSTLDVISRHPGDYRVCALTANTDVEGLARQCIQWRPEFAVMADADSAQQLQQRLRAEAPHVEVLAGVEGLQRVASLEQVDTVIAGIVGAAGLLPTLAAAQAGKTILLANKEALVMSGRLFMDAVHRHGATLLPLDSEHNAIFQCMPTPLPSEPVSAGIERILLTASGGPFRTRPLHEFDDITPEQAVSHPNWDMGRKISVDSATMMNKGLEVIEAHWLFNLAHDAIEVVIHPQSIIHSMVAYIDGSVLAQLGNPDMRTPIAHALAWPRRIHAGVEPLDLFEVAQLQFERPDLQRFPCLRLCYQAMQAGGSATITLNAANEIAVEAFLQRRLGFTAIAQLIEHVLEKSANIEAGSLEEILAADADARLLAHEYIAQIKVA